MKTKYRIVLGAHPKYPSLYSVEERGVLWGWNHVSVHAFEDDAREALKKLKNPATPKVIHEE